MATTFEQLIRNDAHITKLVLHMMVGQDVPNDNLPMVINQTINHIADVLGLECNKSSVRDDILRRHGYQTKPWPVYNF